MAQERIFIKKKRLLSPDDCVSYFSDFLKEPIEPLVGLEYEVILVDSRTGLNVPYFGDRGIAQLLTLMLADGYIPFYDSGLITALRKEKAVVSLEPGGQIEFSSSPHNEIEAVRLELGIFLHTLDKACKRLAIRWLPIGYRPFGTTSSVPTVPRTRYLHLMPILELSAGAEAGQKMTASMQISTDYFSSTHAGKLLRLGMFVQPYIVAACANSPFGPISAKCKSQRIIAWSHFNSCRCEAPDFLFNHFELAETFNHYASWALEKPLLFIQRADTYLNVKGTRFIDFLNQGFDRETADLQDWAMHLGTLYPYARLKNVVEFRAADTCQPKLATALLAFWKGLSYSEAELDAALRFSGIPQKPKLSQSYVEAATHGLRGRDIHGASFAKGISYFLELAASGLTAKESAHLQPLRNLAKKNTCPADQLLSTPAYIRGF